MTPIIMKLSQLGTPAYSKPAKAGVACVTPGFNPGPPVGGILISISLMMLLCGCPNGAEAPAAPEPPKASAESVVATASATASASASAPPAEPPDAGVLDAATDAATDAAAEDAGADAGETAVDWTNKIEPTEGPELQERAKGLFEAIVADEPEKGEAFWFPKEPFIPLKDVKGPGKYWDQLHRTYLGDIHRLHRKRKSWDGATFVRFDIGSKPKWVKPGDEVNKIGYYRSFHGKLRYDLDGKTYTIDVHTVITWQGRWHITHLSKFKK